LKHLTYVIIDDDSQNALKTQQTLADFQTLSFLASASNYDDALDCILECQPNLVFLEIDPSDTESNLSLSIINELYRYLSVVPKIVVTTKNDTLSLAAFKFGVFDYLLFPLETKEIRKTLFRLEKEVFQNIISTTFVATTPVTEASSLTNEIAFQKPITSNTSNEKVVVVEAIETPKDSPIEEAPIENEVEIETVNELETEIYSTNFESDATEDVVFENQTDDEVTFQIPSNNKEQPLIICVKSYGDYRYIDAKDICYLQADNNSTDIHLNSGEMITAFKTLKHFEGVLQYPFVRIHNSYILNIDFVSRIHTGNSVCHIKNTTTKLPFSKSYKENIDKIIASIASGNYIEI
jgi:DNA-binding LytR/AlgR family response regulator